MPGSLPVLDSPSACSVQCGGRCCEDFPINLAPERIGENYVWSVARIHAGEDSRHDWDVVTVAEMVIRIDEPDEAKPRYACSHLDRATGLCSIYDRRPRMCSDFPTYWWNGACHICGWQREPVREMASTDGEDSN